MASLSLTQRWLKDAVQSYPNSQRVYADADAVLSAHPTLRPKADVYTFDDGRTQLLLCIHGLLPITFRNASYNIPIAVWVTREYPRQPPIAYVVPTTDMLVKAGRYVDVSGRCSIEYTQGWERKHEGCSLSALVAALQDHFAREPPVYAKPPPTSAPPALPGKPPAFGPSPPPLPPHPNHHQQQHYIPSPPVHSQPLSPPPPPPLPPQIYHQPVPRPQPYASPPAAHPTPPPPPPPPPLPPQLLPPSLPPLPPVAQPHLFRPEPPRQPIPDLLDDTTTTPASIPAVLPAGATSGIPPPRPPNPELLRLQSAVHQKLSSELNSLSQALALDAEKLRAQQADLLAGEPAIKDEMARLEAVRDVCRSVADRTRRAVTQAEANIADLRRKGDPEVDELVCATSIVHNQLINLIADDNAIEDTIYHLHRALNAGRIDLEKFLRATRLLAEEQFMKRALIEKIQNSVTSSSMAPDWAAY